MSLETDLVSEDVKQWHNRALDSVYPIIYLDALVVKVRSEGAVSNHAAYVALGVNLEGYKEVLGQNEGAKFWLRVLTELRPPHSSHEDVLRALWIHPDHFYRVHFQFTGIHS